MCVSSYLYRHLESGLIWTNSPVPFHCSRHSWRGEKKKKSLSSVLVADTCWRTTSDTPESLLGLFCMMRPGCLCPFADFEPDEREEIARKGGCFHQKEKKIGNHTKLLGLPAAERTTVVYNILQAQPLLCWYKSDFVCTRINVSVWSQITADYLEAEAA